jgi:hypothetical protein
MVFWYGKPRERDNLGNPGIDGDITLKWVFRNWEMVYGPDRAAKVRWRH